MEDLFIDVNQQLDGYNFSLNPLSKLVLSRLLPDNQRLIGKLFVAFDTRSSFEAQYGPVINHIVLTILGLSATQFADLKGKFRQVVFRNPGNKENVHVIAFDDVKE